MTRDDVLTAEAVAVGGCVLLLEHRERVGYPDRRAMAALKRDQPGSVSGAIMQVMIETFVLIADQYGPAALRRAGLVVATARLEVA